MIMKQYTSPEQTAKLIELGYFRPALSWKPPFGGRDEIIHNPFSIGELINILPRTIKLYYDLNIFSTSQGWWVLYGMISDGDMWSIEYELYRGELIDALYDMCVQLKEAGEI